MDDMDDRNDHSRSACPAGWSCCCLSSCRWTNKYVLVAECYETRKIVQWAEWQETGPSESRHGSITPNLGAASYLHRCDVSQRKGPSYRSLIRSLTIILGPKVGCVLARSWVGYPLPQVALMAKQHVPITQLLLFAVWPCSAGSATARVWSVIGPCRQLCGVISGSNAWGAFKW